MGSSLPNGIESFQRTIKKYLAKATKGSRLSGNGGFPAEWDPDYNSIHRFNVRLKSPFDCENNTQDGAKRSRIDENKDTSAMSFGSVAMPWRQNTLVASDVKNAFSPLTMMLIFTFPLCVLQLIVGLKSSTWKRQFDNPIDRI